ncbi:MAG: hypothetical protein WCB19_07370 [Thermoplasmata archaeon]
MRGQLTIDTYLDPPRKSLDPAFQETIAAVRRYVPEQFELLRKVALRLAAERGDRGFTAEDMLDQAGGRDKFRRCMPGVVLGSLRAIHALCVVGRVKSKHPEAKGRWLNVFSLNADAIQVSE